MHFCDQDDVWHPDKVRVMQETLERAEDQYGAGTPLLVFTDQTVVDENLREIAPSLMRLQRQDPEATDYRNILFQNIVTGCTSAINRSLAVLAGQCRDTTQIIMHDWWLALVAARFGKLVYLDVATVDYRQHGGNSVGAKNVFNFEYILSKLRNKAQLKQSVRGKKAQALCFAASYEKKLDEKELTRLQQFGMERSPLRLKWAYRQYVSGIVWALLVAVLW